MSAPTASILDDWTPPEGWPKMDQATIRTMLTAPGQPFEMETLDIRGVPIRTWKNAPPTMRAILAVGRTHGEREFLVLNEERVTYDAFHRAVAALAAHLQSIGIEKGDRVALAMRNLPEWPVAFYAICVIGAIAVPLNAWWTAPELCYGLKNSGSKMLIAGRERWERIGPHCGDLPDLKHIIVARHKGDLPAEAQTMESIIGAPNTWANLPDADLPPADVQPDDEATIFYTSGTTGEPKGALGTHRNFATNIMSSAYAMARAALRRGEMPEPSPPKKVLVVIPLFHVTATSAMLMGGIIAGHTFVFMHKWDPILAFEIIEREGIQITGGVPFIAWQLIEHPEREKYDLSTLENISYGGAPSAPELVKKIHALFGALPGNGWGMTETTATVTMNMAEDYLTRPTSCGLPVATADVEVRAEDGVTVLPAGQIGELWSRGPMNVKGYWAKPEATAETFVDGWVRTGDLAKFDDEGYCYIVDRAKDMIIRGGENIYCSEVENVLYAHPAVTDAALIGLPDEAYGEVPAAVVKLAPGMSASEAEIKAWVKERQAAFKVPVRVVFTDAALPRNANGKILKGELKGMFAA